MALTVSRWFNFILSDAAGTLRAIPVDTINDVGLDYQVEEMTAFQDAMKGALPNTPECVIEISGRFSTDAAAAAPALSGSHTVLSALNGLITPLSVDIQIGLGAAWTNGSPQFGITKSATSGFIVVTYQLVVATMRYKSKLVMFPGSAAPAWGTAAET